MTSRGFRIAWGDRQEPRLPCAVAASGAVSRALAEKLLGSERTDWSRWRGAAASDTLILVGEADSLPWVDGVSYLGSDERAPHLLLPTNRDPGLPLDLLQQAVMERSPFPPPLAVLERRNLVVSLSQARELSPDLLRAWLGNLP